jgi:glycosyltransferase involved in cell wall biosynthesis
MTSVTPFFSVVIPTYNRGDVLKEAISSILAQTFTDFELIVVDDGSSDNTAEVVQSFSNSDPRVIYVYQENAERSAARNNGIEQSRGQYICFLDSDDIFTRDHLAQFRVAIKNSESPIALFYCNATTVGPGKSVKSHLATVAPSKVVAFILENPIPSQQVCIHRDILKDNKFDPKIRIGEDKELWFRISENHELKGCDHCTVTVRDLGDRSTDPKNIWAYKENIMLINHLGQIDKSNRITPSLLRSLRSSAYLKLAISYLNVGKRFAAFHYVVRSIMVWPTHKYKYKVITLLQSLHLGILLPEQVRNAYK